MAADRSFATTRRVLAFDDDSSWDTLDLSGIGGSIPGGPCGCVGFEWAVFDGRYLYFVPGNDGSGDHGEILRFDTTGDFSDPNDWLMYDVVANGIASGACPDCYGYSSGGFDGRYVYLVPDGDGGTTGGEILRYDTLGAFGSSASWELYDMGLPRRL